MSIALKYPQTMTINGLAIENVITGYTTLEVTGREPFDREITTIVIKTQDGERYSRRRLTKRTITVRFVIEADTPEQNMALYERLNSLLDFEQAKIVFADEPDKYYVGTAAKAVMNYINASVSTGTITIYCADPYKYSLEEKEAAFEDGVAEIYYAGTAGTYPTFEATMASSNGFISFTKDGEDTLLFGDDTDPGDDESPAEPDPDALVEYAFDTAVPSGTNWVQNDGVLPYVASPTAIGGAVAVGGDPAGLYGSTFGTNNNKWHGPTLSYHLDGQKTECELSFYHILEATANAQCGLLQVSLTSASGNVAAISCWKNGTGSKTGGYDLYINGSRKKSVSYSMAAGNKISGTAGGHSSIAKSGSVITFNVAGNIYQYTDASLEDVAVTYFTFYFAKWNAATYLNKNRLYSFRFTSPDEGGGGGTVIEHAFLAGDVFRADCSSAETTINGIVNYSVQNIANEWQAFKLEHGKNIITCDVSDWADAPEVVMRYREVFI